MANITITDGGNPITNGTNLQNAINNAVDGDVITLVAGVTYQIDSLELPARNGAANYVTIQSDSLSKFARQAVPGQPWTGRVGPGDAAFMPKIIGPTSSSVRNLPVIWFSPAAKYWKFVGVEVAPWYPGLIGFIVIRADGAQAGDPMPTSIGQCPQFITLDRCYVHSLQDIANEQLQNGLLLDTLDCTLTNNYISGFATASSGSISSDSHAALIIGPGPYTIWNNYFEAVHECVQFGYGDPTNTSLPVPGAGATGKATTYVQYNTFTKLLRWNPNSSSYRPPTDIAAGNTAVGLQNYPNAYYVGGGGTWFAKNIFEIKNGKNLVVDRNFFQYSWDAGDQHGAGIVINLVNYSGSGWEQASNIQFTNNVIDNVKLGFSFSHNAQAGSPPLPSEVVRNVRVQHNLVTNVCGPLTNVNDDAHRGLLAINVDLGDSSAFNGLIIDHNTLVPAATTSQSIQAFFEDESVQSGSYKVSQRNLAITNNVVPTGDYGFLPDYDLPTAGFAGNDTTACNTVWPSPRKIAGNVAYGTAPNMAGAFSGLSGGAANACLSSQSDVGFVTSTLTFLSTNGQPVSVTAYSTSYDVKTTDRKPPGVDVSALQVSTQVTLIPTTTSITSAPRSTFASEVQVTVKVGAASGNNVTVNVTVTSP